MPISSLLRYRPRSRPDIRWLSAAALCGAATLAQAAGFTFIEVPADKDGPALRGAVWSPCSTPAGRIDLAPLVLQGTRDCPVAGQGLPLVVVSHGAGGSALGHHDTAAALADAGYVVAAINHPGDNFQDMSRQGHLSAFATRPVDMRRLTDYMLGAWPQRAQLDAGKVGFLAIRAAATRGWWPSVPSQTGRCAQTCARHCPCGPCVAIYGAMRFPPRQRQMRASRRRSSWTR